MNATNQMSVNVKQLKLQAPISALDFFAKTINELKTMYPIKTPQEKNKKQ